ncbi:MAG: hypothetical protein O9345_21320 [Burkholderiaceae bacterium]|jgi:hypothetical protein|nr:hypothetical protein [Burkholderiales bacterium]MCZ8103702.1 hypothetical protein [Burkholderiales bacterium]MCZ8340661.1 hypothetical protein [Burkholderiaceae bacterium]
MTVGGAVRATLVLLETKTASGARREADGDPRTWVWNRGERTQPSLDGVAWPECVETPAGAGAPPIAVPFVARGNEPLWRLDLDARRIRFVTGLDAAPVEAPTPAPRRRRGPGARATLTRTVPPPSGGEPTWPRSTRS